MFKTLPQIFVLIPLLLASGCGKSNASYFPVDVGLWRYYETETKVLDETKTQRVMAGIAEITETDKGDVYIHRQAPDQDSYLQISSGTIVRLAHRDRSTLEEAWFTEPVKVLPIKPSLGETWKVKSELALIESRTFARQDKLRRRTIGLDLSVEVTALGESVNIPAGNFDNCLRLQSQGSVNVRTDRGNASAEVSVSQTDWYAPGTGLIKSERFETSDSPFLKSGSYRQVMLAIGRD